MDFCGSGEIWADLAGSGEIWGDLARSGEMWDFVPGWPVPHLVWDYAATILDFVHFFEFSLKKPENAFEDGIGPFLCWTRHRIERKICCRTVPRIRSGTACGSVLGRFFVFDVDPWKVD